MTELLVGGRCHGRAAALLDRVADLVNLLQRGQEVDGARSLTVIELLAVEVHFEPAAVGRGEGDRGLPVVDRRQLGSHTDGHGEVPSDDAVHDLDATLTVRHFGAAVDTECLPHPRGDAAPRQYARRSRSSLSLCPKERREARAFDTMMGGEYAFQYG